MASLSARRAWIEINALRNRSGNSSVALRKESVDRNYSANAVDQILPGSLSARRAWIEIDIPPNLDADHAVALRKESVDRNNPLL